MRTIVGVDIGNSTTEACVAVVGDGGEVTWRGGELARTTGVKGTLDNVRGARRAILLALERCGLALADVDAVLVNEATPVISGMAMETITETIITESTMIGHNPATPGGVGLGVGRTVALADLGTCAAGEEVVCVIAATVDFADAAAAINAAVEAGVEVRGGIVQRDDARLIANRLQRPIPLVDEVSLIDRVPLDMVAAVEVAAPGRTISTLSNSYGLATVFELSADETRMVAPVARALVGTRSAVVVRTPSGDVTDRRIPAGVVALAGENGRVEVDVGEGADAIMRGVARVQPLQDASGEAGTNAGGMLATVRETMAELTGDPVAAIRIRDVLAVDTFVPQEVRGGLAGEFALEGAVALAAMVRTSRGPMERLAAALGEDLGCEVVLGGVEADMAIRGALTTPGTAAPLAILDLGGGSTDAALIDRRGVVRTVHVAGAGDLVTRLIGSELGLGEREAAEDVKRHPLAKVESPFQLRLEDGTTTFFEEPLPAEAFARVVALDDEGGLRPIPSDRSLERVRAVRREAKRRVFVVNALRALEQIAPGGSLRRLEFVVLLGGSALDFEIGEMIAEALGEFGVVCGTGNVRGVAGPRSAVATGLVDAYVSGLRAEVAA